MSSHDGSPQSTSPAPAIRARGVVKHYAGELALAGVDFELRGGGSMLCSEKTAPENRR